MGVLHKTNFAFVTPAVGNSLSLHDPEEGKPVLTQERRDALIDASRDGKLRRLRFTATVSSTIPNRNHVRFDVPREDFAKFAQSFKGKPFLRDHAGGALDARGGTILDSWAEEREDGAQAIRQTIEVVKPWAVEGVLDGTIDRFSIGWHADEIDCSICGKPFLACWDHMPGWKYDEEGRFSKKGERQCEVLMRGIQGNETSAVLIPAVSDTEISAMELSDGAARPTLTALSALHEVIKEQRSNRAPSLSAPPEDDKLGGDVVKTKEQLDAEAAEAAKAAEAAEAAEAAKAAAALPAPEPTPAPAPKPELNGKIRRFLGLPEDAPDEDVEKAVDALLGDEDEAPVPAAIAKALDCKDGATLTDTLAAIVALKAPKEEEVSQADLTKAQEENKFLRAAERVRHYLSTGKISAHQARIVEGGTIEQQGYAMQQALTNLKVFEKWASEKEPAVPLHRENPSAQLDGRISSADTLTAEEESCLSRMGQFMELRDKDGKVVKTPREMFLAEKQKISDEAARRAAAGR